MLGDVYYRVYEGENGMDWIMCGGTMYIELTFILDWLLTQSDPKRYQHMLNAIKYSTSLWPLCVSAYQKTVTDDDERASLETLLIVLLA